MAAATQLASGKAAKLTTAARSSGKPRSNEVMAAAAKPAPVESGTRWVSVTEASLASDLPRGCISSWIDLKLVRSLKVGAGNSKRIVDLHDVLSFRDQSLAPSMPRRLTPGCRALLYTRIDPDAADDPDAEVDRVHARFFEHMQQQHPTLAASFRCAEVGNQASLDRPGFVRLMALILAREIDILLVTDAEQLCPPAYLPLFEWILKRNYVTLRTEALPALVEADSSLQPGRLISDP